MKIKRDRCIVCEKGELKVFLNYQMPVYSSEISETDNHIVSDILFSECENCNTIQLKECVSPELVYQFNHNREVVGQTWEKHYDDFVDFMKDLTGKTILEISDPVAKLPKKMSGFKKWYIVEPHSSMNLSTNNIIFIDKFFDENFDIDEKIDVIVHSHFFEHTLEPLNFLTKCNSLLCDGGKMFVSVPNLESILNQGNNPNSVLHFEHTFYFDSQIFEYLCNKAGFKIISKREFKKHSLFFELIKVEGIEVYDVKFISNVDKFLNSYEKYKNIVKMINESDEKYILFGCHISSQFLIYNGLNLNKIKFIIDNSKSKQGNFLYGTNIKCKSPNEILNLDLPVIVSHMGVYSEEISKDLLKIKNNLKLI